jgi:hypothetical protein
MSEFQSAKESAARTGAAAATGSSAASPTLDSPSSVVNVPLRRMLVNDLNQHQRQLSDYVDGFIGARDRELAITRIWERYFATPSRRAFLKDQETWAEVAEVLEGVDSFGTLLRNELGTDAGGWATTFDDELKSMKEKISAARFDDSPPADSANEVRRCVEKVKPAVREIRVMCQNGVQASLRELSMRIERIFELFEVQSNAGGAGFTTAEKLPVVAEEGERAAVVVKSPATEEAHEGQAATKESEGEISMETGS